MAIMTFNNVNTVPTATKPEGTYHVKRVDDETKFDTYIVSNGVVKKQENNDEKITKLGRDAPVINVTYEYPMENGWHTLTTALNIIPANRRKTGLIITFATDSRVWARYQYIASEITQVPWITSNNWRILPMTTSVILPFTTNVETTRNLVPSSERQYGFKIIYDSGDRIVSEMFIGRLVTGANWTNNNNWVSTLYTKDTSPESGAFLMKSDNGNVFTREIGTLQVLNASLADFIFTSYFGSRTFIPKKNNFSKATSSLRSMLKIPLESGYKILLEWLVERTKRKTVYVYDSANTIIGSITSALDSVEILLDHHTDYIDIQLTGNDLDLMRITILDTNSRVGVLEAGLDNLSNKFQSEKTKSAYFEEEFYTLNNIMGERVIPEASFFEMRDELLAENLFNDITDKILYPKGTGLAWKAGTTYGVHISPVNEGDIITFSMCGFLNQPTLIGFYEQDVWERPIGEVLPSGSYIALAYPIHYSGGNLNGYLIDKQVVVPAGIKHVAFQYSTRDTTYGKAAIIPKISISSHRGKVDLIDKKGVLNTLGFPYYEYPVAYSATDDQYTGGTTDNRLLNTDPEYIISLYDAVLAGLNTEKWAVTKENMGLSTAGNFNIYRYTIDPILGRERTCFFTFLMHGTEEWTSYGFIEMLKTMYGEPCNDIRDYLSNHVRIIFIPVLNPYGYNIRQYGGRGFVNFSRNFPYFWYDYVNDKDSAYDVKGSAPLSENETIYVYDTILEKRAEIDFCIDFHQGPGVTGPYFYYDSRDTILKPRMLKAANDIILDMINKGAPNMTVEIQETPRALNLLWANRLANVPYVTIEFSTSPYGSRHLGIEQLTGWGRNFLFYMTQIFRGDFVKNDKLSIIQISKSDYEAKQDKSFQVLYVTEDGTYIGDKGI